MNERSLGRIIAGFAALVALFLVVRVGSYLMREKPSTGGALGDALESLRSDTLIGAIIARPGGQRVELLRTQDAWAVNGYAADSSVIAQLASSAAEARIVDLAARNADSHGRLGVTTDSAWSIELRGRRDTIQFLLGAAGRGYDQAYARLSAENDVYVIGGGLRGALDRQLSEWRDKAIVRVDTAKVQRLIVDRDRREARVARTDSVWSVVGGPGSVDLTRVGDVLSELSRFDAADFVADSVAFAGKERRKVLALGASGDTLVLLEFAGDSTRWLVRARGNTQLYDVAAFRADRVSPRASELIRRR